MDILPLKIHMYPWKNRNWQIQRNPVNAVTNGPKTFGCINKVFYKKMYGRFCQAAKKSGCNNKVAVMRDFAVV